MSENADLPELMRRLRQIAARKSTVEGAWKKAKSDLDEHWAGKVQELRDLELRVQEEIATALAVKPGEAAIKTVDGDLAVVSLPPSVVLDVAEELVIQRAEGLAPQCVRVRKELDKAALKALPPQALSTLGARLVGGRVWRLKLRDGGTFSWPLKAAAEQAEAA